MAILRSRLPWASVPELRPFSALRYDLRLAGRAPDLLCPPYDVIAPAERARLAARHPLNAVHLELPRDEEGRPDYEGAARLLAEWQEQAVLRPDERPMLYAYEQAYRLPEGDRGLARGFFCLLRLEPLGADAGVRAHERTMSGPKEDRLRLLRAVRANLSPVLMLYDAGDGGQASAALLNRLTAEPPVLEAVGQDGQGQRLWATAAEGSQAAASLLDLAGRGALTIADGHHRYETALRYRDEVRAKAAGVPSPGAEWLLVLLFDADSGGLSVLPTHRLVEGGREGAAVLEAARGLFAVEPVASGPQLLEGLRRPGRLGLWTAAGAALLEPRRERLASLLPPAASEALRWLDVMVLTSALPTLVGEDPQALLEAGRLDYVKDAAEVLARAAASERGYAFLLPPTPVSAVLQVAAAGEQMPHKSTYFEPKPATGLVFNRLAA